MIESAKGATVCERRCRVEPIKLEELSVALGTPTAETTAKLVLFFGPTVAGEAALVEVLGLDFSKALLVGHRYEIARPFVPGEELRVTVSIGDVYSKGNNQFGIVVSEFVTIDDELVQVQRTTFIERSA